MKGYWKLMKQSVLSMVLGASLALSTSAEIPFRHVIVDDNQPTRPYTKIIGDLDGDKFPDIIIAGAQSPLLWYTYPEWTKTVIAEGGYKTVDGEVGDIDGDGDLDIVMGGTFWYENPRPNGDPQKGPWKAHQIADHRTHDVEVGDLDGDGDLDVVTRDQSDFGTKKGNEIHIWMQENPDQWKEHMIHCPHGEGIVLADLDGDGDPDIVIGGIWFENTQKILDGEWIEHSFAEWHPSASVDVADFNLDGRMDIALTPSELRGNYYKIAWFEAPNDPVQENWKEHRIEENVECIYHSLVAADMDNDGDPDIVTAEMHQGEDPDEVMVYINQGKGKSFHKHILSKKGTHDTYVGDIGNDGDLDIIGANHAGEYSPVELWENQLNP